VVCCACRDDQAIDRRERLRRLALETIDLAKDPYFMRNHLGQYECRLCLTLHNNEGNYLAHTQARVRPPPRTPSSPFFGKSGH
jgi:splicing factor 3A subunit 2